jgi:hypothetical protein
LGCGFLLALDDLLALRPNERFKFGLAAEETAAHSVEWQRPAFKRFGVHAYFGARLTLPKEVKSLRHKSIGCFVLDFQTDKSAGHDPKFARPYDLPKFFGFGVKFLLVIFWKRGNNSAQLKLIVAHT